jgi:hypothetical protein
LNRVYEEPSLVNANICSHKSLGAKLMAIHVAHTDANRHRADSLPHVWRPIATGVQPRRSQPGLKDSAAMGLRPSADDDREAILGLLARRPRSSSARAPIASRKVVYSFPSAARTT